MTTERQDQPAPLGAIISQRPETGSRPARSPSLAGSPPGLPEVKPTTRLEFARAMAHLCTMKRTAELTDEQLELWHQTLGSFPAKVINSSVLELVLTEVRFPELGDLYQLCRKKAIKAMLFPLDYNPNGTGEVPKITEHEIRAIAARLGLDVL